MAASLSILFAPKGAVKAVGESKIPGSFAEAYVAVTGDGSYPSGGYPLALAQLQALFGNVYSLVDVVEVVGDWADGIAQPSHAFVASYDRVNLAVRALGMAAAAGAGTPLLEVPATTSLAAYTCVLKVRLE